VDRIYPWLSPTNPAQWASLGLLLFSGLSLIIHISVVVAGAESAAFGRSLGLALVYLVAALGQTALVPNGDFAVFSMLIGNTAMALFSLRGLFGLARSSTFVALAVQLGFLTLAWGVLELISSLLGSVAAA
ncbi:MAG: hypothetical protein KDE27_05055, partial [Planctomycetes bacterium]|nr:hypothetical protein [Planctomycetota bacterium]